MKIGDVAFTTSLRVWMPDAQASYAAPKGRAFAVLLLGDADKKDLSGFDPGAALNQLGWVAGAETEALEEKVARAIATNGFGRAWDDFEEVNAHDTDRSDLLDYARAAIAEVYRTMHDATPKDGER